MTKTPSRLPVSVCVPTYGREAVLIDTIRAFLAEPRRAAEILVIDQTPQHEEATESQLRAWDDEGGVRWLRQAQASQPVALNHGLREASQPYVLFVDDDIRFDPGFLQAHVETFDDDGTWAVAGQVLQPGETPDDTYRHQPEPGCFTDRDFMFRSAYACCIENGMSGNLCVRRDRARDIGGFDENFLPPVAYRFDNEFCKRLCRAGGRIRFAPEARIYHLRAQRGGTRSNSNHMTSISPEHGVGDYYFALRVARGWPRVAYLLRRPFREVRTRFHLRHPWWIPVKFIGELRALALALCLYRHGPVLLDRAEGGVA